MRLRKLIVVASVALAAGFALPLAAQQRELASYVAASRVTPPTQMQPVTLLSPVAIEEDGTLQSTLTIAASCSAAASCSRQQGSGSGVVTTTAASESEALDTIAPDEYAPQPEVPYYIESHGRPHYFQILPDGLLYKSYLAGEKEPRFGSAWLHEKDRGWVWEAALGGRVGLLRNGTAGAHRPEGWQLDIEGAVFARLDWEVGTDLEAADFRVGMISTWRTGPTAYKAGYYHISSHVGDEFLIRNPGFNRLNYVRDTAIVGIRHDLTYDVAIYAEAAYAPGAEGGALPWEFQFGAEYSPICANGCRGRPFAAANAHLRQEFDFGGSINVMAGWQWRGADSDRLFRAGMQYYTGKALQYSFVNQHEDLLGLGIWFDY